ncbi:peptide chain release factor N(5)-glutamine methyltransferase [Rickettsiales bacterium]|nr:peptide chain release factor N(5)-glutamine methyltransferase [Rickettsiales bacterium]
MSNIGQVLKSAKELLNKASITSYAIDAELILMHVLDISRERIIGYPETEISDDKKNEFEEMLRRRINREPISHIIGKREFWGMEFKVTNKTLDPRPDSETIIEAVLDNIKDRNKDLKILDLGTGTGCLLLSVLSEYKNAQGVGIDISYDAIKVANYNSIKLGLAKRVGFVVGMWAEAIDCNFDVIISNPPYIRCNDIEHLQAEVSKYEPISALDGGEDGFSCYRQIAPYIRKMLNPAGIAVIEHGIGQESEITKILVNSGFESVNYRSDLSGISRCIIVNA